MWRAPRLRGPGRSPRPRGPHCRHVRRSLCVCPPARTGERRDPRSIHDRSRRPGRMSSRASAGSFATTWLAPLVGLLVAAIVGDILILSFGQSPGEVYRLLIEGTWGNAYGLGQVLYKATTLTFTGLAVALGLRAGLFNIGAEGQLAAGGFAAAMAGLLLPAGTPAVLAVPVCLGAAAVGGGVVGAVPGAL